MIEATWFLSFVVMVVLNVVKNWFCHKVVCQTLQANKNVGEAFTRGEISERQAKWKIKKNATLESLLFLPWDLVSAFSFVLFYFTSLLVLTPLLLSD